MYRCLVCAVGIVDPCAVLISDVPTLAILRCRINGQEVQVKELLKGDLLWIIDDMHRLSKARIVLANLLVGRVFLIPVGIAHLGGDNPTYLLEEMLCPPETSPS